MGIKIWEKILSNKEVKNTINKKVKKMSNLWIDIWYIWWKEEGYRLWKWIITWEPDNENYQVEVISQYLWDDNLKKSIILPRNKVKFE